MSEKTRKIAGKHFKKISGESRPYGDYLLSQETSEKFGLDDKVPLVLFFRNVADRQEFVDIIKAAKPDMVSFKIP